MSCVKNPFRELFTVPIILPFIVDSSRCHMISFCLFDANSTTKLTLDVIWQEIHIYNKKKIPFLNS